MRSSPGYPSCRLPVIAFLLSICTVAVLAQDEFPCGNPPQPGPPDACGTCGGGIQNADCCTASGGGGGNPFNPFSGSVSREIPDIELPYQVGEYPIEMSRYLASRWDAYPHIAFDTPLGDAGNWRHSFLWSILDAGTNDIGEISIRIIHPSGRFGNFAKDSTNATHMTFRACTHERVLPQGTNFYYMFIDGTKHHFVSWTDGTSTLYRMEATIDPWSNKYDFVYSDGQLSEVTGPNTNQYIRFTYQSLTNSVDPGTIEFTYVDSVATQVMLWGSFYGTESYPMTQSGGSNWSRSVELESGFHQYKFVVRYPGSNDVWKLDPENELRCYDDITNFNQNSVAVIDPYDVISSVELSDGRTVSYDYDWVEGVGLIHILLTGANYGDGTQADYSYYHPSNDLWRKPLLMTADDPHYEGPARAVRYIYQTNNLYTGQIYEERSLTTSQLLARLIISGSTPYLRKVISDDGAETVYSYSDTDPVLTNAVGYTWQGVYYEGFDDPTMLWKRIDPMGRTTVYERVASFGVATQIWNSVKGTKTVAFTGDDYPFYRTQEVDYLGRTNAYERDAFNRVTKHTFPDGTYEAFTYNDHAQILTETRRDGSIITYTYDVRGRRTSRADNAGTEYFGYDGYDRLAATTNKMGYVTRLYYNWRGAVTNKVYPDGTQETMLYDTYGQLTSRVDRAGGQTTCAYDEVGRKSSMTDPLGNTTYYDYNLEGRLLSVQTPMGLIVSNTYDGIGRKTRETYSSDSSYREWGYDPDGVRTQRDRLGGFTLTDYDAAGYVRRVEDPEGRVTTYANNVLGWRHHVTNALYEATSYTYDLAGRVVTIQDCGGNLTSNTYDGMGRLLARVEPGGITNQFVYDATGRRVAMLRNGLLIQSNRYDALGRVLWRQDASGLIVTNTYNTMGLLLRSYMPDGTYSENRYTNTWLYMRLNRAGQSMTYQRDALGRVTNQIDNAGYSVKQAYDVGGSLTNLVDQAGNATRFSYDEEGRLTRKTYADDSYIEYVHDAEGRLESKVDAKNKTTTFLYDAVGNLTNVVYDSDPAVFMQYDALNRMTELIDAVGTTTYAYAEGCTAATSVDGPFDSDEITYTYDDAKRLTNMNFSSFSIGYAYDVLGRIAGVQDGAGSYAYAYDANGNLISSLSRANGTISAYEYDQLKRLTNLAHRTSAGAMVSSFGYSYNDADQRTQLAREDGSSVAYGYDDINELTSATGTRAGHSFKYAYDPAGNPTLQDRNGYVMTNTFNDLNQNLMGYWSGSATVMGSVNTTSGTLTVEGVAGEVFADNTFAATNISITAGTNVLDAVLTDKFDRSATNTVTVTAGDRTYQYDANGNLTNDGHFAYVWNDADRLVEVNDAGSGDPVMSCRYDGLGHRRERVVYSGGVGTTNKYVYHGWLVMAVLDADDNVIEEYTHGPDLSGTLGGAGGIGGILAVTEAGSSTNYYYHCDAMGNVINVTDSNESTVATYTYSPFGLVLTKTGSFDARYQFSSKEWDSDVGLSYYGYRYYDPELGRWMSRDPIGERNDVSLYRFVANGPANWTDSVGLLTWVFKTIWDVYNAVDHGTDLFHPGSTQHGTLPDIIHGGQSADDYDGESLSGTRCSSFGARGQHEYCSPDRWLSDPMVPRTIERSALTFPGTGDGRNGGLFIYRETTIREHLTCTMENCTCQCDGDDPSNYRWSCVYAGPGSTHSRTRVITRWTAVGGIVVTPPAAGGPNQRK